MGTEAIKKAPYYSKLTERDLAKAKVYRDAAFTNGHNHYPGLSNLYPHDDPTLRELHKQDHTMAFVKHMLTWDDDKPNLCKAVHGEEGFTHGPSASLRGFDPRFFWDANTLKVVGTVRFSEAATIMWQPAGGEEHTWQADGAQTWLFNQVHGGCIEAVLDDLTAEVMKVNVAPQNLTAEITFKIKVPIATNQTYKLEAEITDCSPPRCMTAGRILSLDGKTVMAEATAKMAMMDRMGGSAISSGGADGQKEVFVPAPPCDPQVTKERSLNRVYQGSLGNGAVDVSDGGGAPAGEIGETMAELKRLQKLLVAQLQAEFFCDDVEPPPAAFGWDEGKLRDYFENGGE